MIGGPVAVLVGAGVRGRRRSGVVGTFAVLMLAAIAMTAGLEVARQGAPQLDAAAAEANVAHLVVNGEPAAVTAVAADPEVVAWSGPFATIDELELVLDDEVVPMALTALDDPDIEVHRPLLQSGRWLGADHEVVLDRSLASDLAIGIGDRITVRILGQATELEVVGTAVSLTDCLYPQCEPGWGWVTSGGLDALGAPDAVFAQGWLRFDDPHQADAFVERTAEEGAEGIGGTNSWLDTRKDFLTLDRYFGTFVSAFGGFVLIVAAVVVAGSMAMRIVARRREIGLLGAVGCTPRQITLSLLLENLALGSVAATSGWFLAGFLAPLLQIGIARTLGTQDPVWSAPGLLVAVGAISGLLVLATVVPAVSAARRPVTDVLRDVPAERTSRLSRRWAALPTRLSLLGVREVASRPARSALAALAIVVAVVGALVSTGFISAIDAVADDPATAGDPWDVAVVRGDLPAVEVEDIIDGTPGVAAWFGDIERRSTLEERAFLSVATGGDPAAASYRVVDGRPMEGPSDAIAGYGFLQRFDVEVGDEVTFRAGATPLTVTIVGWYRDTEDSGVVLRYRIEALEAAEGGVAPEAYRVRATSGSSTEGLAADLSERLGPAVRIEVLDTGAADMQPLILVMRLVAAVLLALAATNLLSTLLISSREAAGRIGVQLAIGFTPRQVRAQGAMAGAALGVLAAVVAVPLGFWVFGVMADSVSTALGVGPGWMPPPTGLAAAALSLLAVVASAALGALAEGRVARRSASDLVRGE